MSKLANTKQTYESVKTASESKLNDMSIPHYDVAIIGGGPAGLTAAIYTSRANLSTIFFQKGAPGGKVAKTSKIENWTGDKMVEGFELAIRMQEHAEAFSAKYDHRAVKKVISRSEFDHELILVNEAKISAKAVIIATGMIERVPTTVKNIEKFENRGVSYCAICDGPLFKNQNVAVIGGGNSAIEESIYLSSIAKHVYIFIRKPEELWAEKAIIKDAQSRKNITIYTHGEICEIVENETMEKVIVKIDNQEKTMEINAIFPYIGQKPVTDFVSELNITDDKGFIPTDEYMETNKKGIYAIGDVRAKEIRQIATAVSDGVIAGKILANRVKK